MSQIEIVGWWRTLLLGLGGLAGVLLTAELIHLLKTAGVIAQTYGRA